MENNTDNLTVTDVSMLEKFKAKANEFMQALNRLNAITDVPPNLQSEYSGLRSTADNIQSTIGWITETVDSVTGYFSDFFGFNGVDSVKNYINDKPQTMGFIPLLPMAAITGAIALMSKFISDVYIFERKISEQKRLEATGVNPAEAAQIVDKISGQGVIQGLTGLVKPVGFALGLFFLTKIIKKQL